MSVDFQVNLLIFLYFISLTKLHFLLICIYLLTFVRLNIFLYLYWSLDSDLEKIIRL